MSLLCWWWLLLLLFLSLNFSADDVGNDDDESTELIEFLERKSEREGEYTTVGADKMI